MASCPKCGRGKIRRRAGGRKKCKRCGFLDMEAANPFGSCFDSAAKLLLTWNRGKAVMCHGVCIANKPGEEGETIAHAWLEFVHEDFKTYAVDPIFMVAQDRYEYRKNLKPSYIRQYKFKEFFELWTLHDYPGPWDPEIKKYTAEGKQQSAHQENKNANI